MASGKFPNTLYYGDNLFVLAEHIADSSVDLVYLDPPFQSNANYNVLFKSPSGEEADAQIEAFTDTWTWDTTAAQSFESVVREGGEVSDAMLAFQKMIGPSAMLAYLAMMAPRLKELKRVLKPSGSIWLHCDPTASHYLKILLDAIFGAKNFRNETIWHYGGRGAKARSNQLPRNHDVLFWYSVAQKGWYYERQYVEERMTEEEAKKASFREDEEGRWFKTAPRGDYTDESIEKLRAEGRIHETKNGNIRIKYFLERDGDLLIDKKLVGDVWNDIPDAMHMPKSEYLGYPTQKPMALLKRIIELSCPPGGVVLDPFCGCGTTIEAAANLKRNWIGIDLTSLAIGLIKSRLGEKGIDDYRVIGEPTTIEDARELAKEDPYQFQWWSLGLVGARPLDKKKGADRGIDGRRTFFEDIENPQEIIISVKAGQRIGPSFVRDLIGTVEREGAAMGALILFKEPTKEMRKEAASAGFYQSTMVRSEHPKIQIRTVEDLLSGNSFDWPVQLSPQQMKANVKKPRSKRYDKQLTIGDDLKHQS